MHLHHYITNLVNIILQLHNGNIKLTLQSLFQDNSGLPIPAKLIEESNLSHTTTNLLHLVRTISSSLLIQTSQIFIGQILPSYGSL